MKTLLLPPIAHLEVFGTGDCHLLLSYLRDHNAYVGHYKLQGSKGAYLILNNAAYENGRGEHAKLLLDLACELRVNEIVCPDVPFNASDTIESAYAAFTYFSGPGRRQFESLKPKLMFVPQGSDQDEWEACFQTLYRAYDLYYRTFLGTFKPVPVVGICGAYDDTFPGGLAGLISKEIYRYCLAGVLDIHILGCPSRLWNLSELALRYPKIRSVSSAKPFVYALNNLELKAGDTIPPCPERDATYFTLTLTDKQLKLAERNRRVFELAARGRVHPPSLDNFRFEDIHNEA